MGVIKFNSNGIFCIVPIAGTRHNRKIFLCLLYSSQGMFIRMIPSEPILSETKQSKLSQPLLLCQILQSCNWFYSPALNLLQFICVSLVTGPV